MVMLARGWKWFAGSFALVMLVVLDRFVSVALAWPMDLAMQPVAAPYNDDSGENEPTDAIYEHSGVEQAPPPAYMPIGNRFVSAEPQNYGRHTPIDDNWWMGTPSVLLQSIAPG